MALLQCAARPFAILARCTSTTSAPASAHYDAVIVGGGMVGNAMACAMGLSRNLGHTKVLLLESGEPKPLVSTPLFSNRVVAVNPASVSFFKSVGVWDKLVEHRVKRVDRLRVVDACANSTIDLEQPFAFNEVAYIVENHAIIACLADRIRASCPNVSIRTNSKVTDCRIPPSLADLATLKLNDGTEVTTSLVIGADGAKSGVRQSLGVGYTGWECGQKGIVATVEVVAEDNNSTAWQRFTPNGPIALLPLSEKYSSITWATNDKHAEELLQLPPEQFIDQLNYFLTTDKYQNSLANGVLKFVDKTMHALCGFKETHVPALPTVVALQSDNRAAFALGFGHSHAYVAPRIALIGDAAHRTHPLAGQGVNLGWADVTKLVTCLEKSVVDGADLGAVTYLSDYDTKGQRHNMPVQVACDWLNRLYRTDATPVVLLRSIGLNAVDRLTLVKDIFVERASSH